MPATTFTIHYADGRPPATFPADFGHFTAISLRLYAWQPGGTEVVVPLATVSRCDLDRGRGGRRAGVWRWDRGRPERDDVPA